MGNNNSHHASNNISTADVVRRPPNRPQAPPSSRPISELGPRGPSYLEPENQVLPKELPSMIKLRPVSMELSKYNTDYQNIYSNQENVDADDNDNIISADKANIVNSESTSTSLPSRPPQPLANGHIANGSVVNAVETQKPVLNGNIQTQSSQNVVPVSTKNAPYRPSHRRQMSLGQEHIILEEPEETIDSRVKLDPLMQSFPGTTGPSLPVKNNFNLDYSYQLTYVQLAEHRRNKTIEELEKRTGKSMSELSADLIEHADKPSFNRDASSRASSRSSGSALSSKKKKAPAPPGQASSSSTPRSTSPSKKTYTVDYEPPIDYDLDSPRKPNQNFKAASPNGMLPRYSAKGLQSPGKVSSTAPAAPPPPGVMPAKKPINLSRNNSMNEKPQLVLKKTPDIKSTAKPGTPEGSQVPWLLEIKTLSEAKAARRQMSQEASENSTPSLPDEDKVDDTDSNKGSSKSVDITADTKPKMVFASSTETLATSTKSEEPEKKSLERSNSMKITDKLTAPSPKLHRHSSTTAFDRMASPRMQRQTSAPVETASGDPVRRLNSLLQHDIKATANAKCLKLVKQTTPVPPKPKDPHTVFREQLQKACAARDQRSETDGTIDEKLNRDNINKSFEFGEVVDDEWKASLDSQRVAEETEELVKPPRYHKNVSVNRNSAYYNKANRGSSFTADKPVSNGIPKPVAPTSPDWTPEVDLDSDDNLTDHEVTKRNGPSDGFKNTIIPNQMSELKIKKKDKKGKKAVAPPMPNEESNKNKFGSVKKFKKSMRQGVKNAFGSISKASGKILKRQRSAEIEMVEDGPRNWSLSASNGALNVNRSSKYQVPNHYENDDTDSDSENLNHENEYAELAFEQNGSVESKESSDEEFEGEIDVRQQVRRSRAIDKKAYGVKKSREEKEVGWC